MRRVLVVALLGLLSGSPVHALTMLLSTNGNASLGGVAFEPDDLVEYDPATNAATKIFDGDILFSVDTEDIDGVWRLPNGNVMLSTAGPATLGGLTFQQDDLVEYNFGTNTATLFMDGAAEFTAAEDIDAFAFLANGNILLSTAGPATLGTVPLTFQMDDLVEYNPTSNTATLFMNGFDEFTASNENIDAVSILGNGNLLLSTVGVAQLGALIFQQDDLVEYNPTTNFVSLFMDGASEFLDTTGENIDAVFVPEPSTAALLTFGLAGLVVSGRRRK